VFILYKREASIRKLSRITSTSSIITDQSIENNKKKESGRFILSENENEKQKKEENGLRKYNLMKPMIKDCDVSKETEERYDFHIYSTV